MKIRYVTIIAFIFHIGYSTAQTSITDSSGITLKEVTISVNKVAETKSTVAQQVNIITSKDIENAQAQSTADLISTTGAASVQKSQQGGGSPVLRGFEANRVLLVVDGVRMNNIIYRAGHLQNIVTLDNATLDRVEVLYGPSSTVYGSDALGGVIHLYTKNPLLAGEDQKSNLKVNAFTRFGSVNDEVTGHVDFNIGCKKFASLTSFTYSSFGDLNGGENQNPFYHSSYGERPYYVERINGIDSLIQNDNRSIQAHSGFSQYDLMEKFLFKPGKHTSHGLNIQYSSSTDVPRYDRLTDPGSAGLNSAEWYYGPQTRLLAAYDMNIAKESSLFQNIHLGLSFQDIEESRHNRNFGSSNLNHRIENVQVMGASLDFQKVTAKHNIRFGLDGQFNTLKSTAERENINTGEITLLSTRYPDGDNTLMNVGLYFSHTWNVSEHSYITDGFRVGYSSLHSTLVDTATLFHLPYMVADQDNVVYSGSIGYIHNPSDNLKLTLLISTGYRVPNLDDLSKIFESAQGAVIVPNVDLKPEKTVNYEIGMTNIFNDKTRWENNIYYTSFYDAIVTDKFTYNGQDSIEYDGTLSQVYANQNKREAYIYGFSSTLKSKCSDQLTLGLMIGYTYGRIKTDSMDAPLDHIPPFMSRLSLNYHNKNFSSDFFVNYNGWKKLKDYNLGGEDNEQYATEDGMPAWLTLNLHLSYKVWKYITVQAGVDNIFDTQYRTFSSGINAPGRNVFAALRFNY
ncbi:TonB-dependent hemoglobin/transferrin/lactoferrin family receptor [soil metagenome]